MTNRIMRIGEMKRREAEDGKLYLEGYFARFNEPYEVCDGWVETVAPGAFSNVLNDPDTKALWNHNRDIVLGSNSARTLALRQDDFGLYGSIEINRNDTDAMNAYARVERGDVSGCSFGFDCRTTDGVTEDGVFQSHNVLCSHAMIKDSEGQQISIQKTDTDVVYITAIFYCTYTASGFGDNGIYPVASENWLIQWMLGTLTQNSVTKGTYIKGHSSVLSNSSDMNNNYIRFKGINFPVGTGDTTNLRFVLSEITISDTEFNTGLIRTLGIPGVGAFTFPDASVFPDYDISHLSLGDGDGETTEYSLQCPLIKSGTLKVYVDSVEQTEGTDYTA